MCVQHLDTRKMTHGELAKLSFEQLRDCLKARTNELDHNDDIDLAEALRYLTGLSDGTHTPESVDAAILAA